MKFTIVERKIKIEDELRQYALRKVEKLDRYFQQDSDTASNSKKVALHRDRRRSAAGSFRLKGENE